MKTKSFEKIQKYFGVRRPLPCRGMSCVELRVANLSQDDR